MEKFSDLKTTLDGKERAFVTFEKLENFWFFSNSVCNLQCKHCYVKSSPMNNSMSFITLQDAKGILKDIKDSGSAVKRFGITGGEPFLNPEIIEIARMLLNSGSNLIILSNGLLPLLNKKNDILALAKEFGAAFSIRISLDDPHQDIYEKERGHNTYFTVISTLKLLSDNNINFSVAGRRLAEVTHEDRLKEYETLFRQRDITINLNENMVIFPEMSSATEIPEITTACWKILGVSPGSLMCANERMVIKKKGSDKLTFVPCTLLVNESKFEMGNSFKDSLNAVYLNHRFCAQFCVLGGASCSST